MNCFAIIAVFIVFHSVQCQLTCSTCNKKSTKEGTGARKSARSNKILEIPKLFLDYENVSIRHSNLKVFRSTDSYFRPKCLDLSQNVQFKWPFFVNSNKLKYLNLSSNHLTTLFQVNKFNYNDDKHNFESLEILDLSYNKIMKFDFAALKSLKNLRILFFEQNINDNYSNSTSCLQFLRYLPRLKFLVTNGNLY